MIKVNFDLPHPRSIAYGSYTQNVVAQKVQVNGICQNYTSRSIWWEYKHVHSTFLINLSKEISSCSKRPLKNKLIFCEQREFFWLSKSCDWLHIVICSRKCKSSLQYDYGTNNFERFLLQGKTDKISLKMTTTLLNNLGVIMDVDELECILANLIYQGKIKGYLAHAHSCLVVSVKNTFPPING